MPLTMCAEKIPNQQKSVIYVPVKRIFPNPFQPRRYFDQTALNELSASIKSVGVLQPISVRRGCGDNYELIAGERRLRASKMAGLSYIPAIVYDISDNESAVIALLENLQRADLSYMEEAEGYLKLMTYHNMTQEEIALKVGKTQSTIANKIRLLKLSDTVKKMLAASHLTERHARALLKLSNEEDQIKVLNQVIKNNLNVSKTEELIYMLLCGETSAAKKKKRFFAGFRSVQIVVNTIRQSVGMIKDAGMNATIKERIYDEYAEYTIRIVKPPKDKTE